MLSASSSLLAMLRRDFLSLCGLAAGSCLVPDAIARVIRDTCVLADQPYLILPRNPKDIIYAYCSGGLDSPGLMLNTANRKLQTEGLGPFMLHLGDPSVEITPPNWRDYLDEFEHRSAGALGADPAHAGPAGRDERGERVNGLISKTKKLSGNGGSSRSAIRMTIRSRSKPTRRSTASRWTSGNTGARGRSG
jgi:hypothetical protein